MKHESKAVVVTDGAFGKSLDELAELRAYRDKTEAALLTLCASTDDIYECEWLADLGLWREPPKDGGA